MRPGCRPQLLPLIGGGPLGTAEEEGALLGAAVGRFPRVRHSSIAVRSW